MKVLKLIFAMVLFVSCNPEFDQLNIINDTDQVIYRYYTCEDSLGLTPSLELFEKSDFNGEERTTSPIYRIPAHESKPILMWGIKEYINGCAGNSIKIFFIKESIMRTNTWEQIVSKQLYVKKIEVNVNELIAQNWTVSYEEE